MTALFDVMIVLFRMMHSRGYPDISCIAKHVISFTIREDITLSIYTKNGKTSDKRYYKYRKHAKLISSIMEKTHRKR